MNKPKPTKWQRIGTDTYATVAEAVADVLKRWGLSADTAVTVGVDNAPTTSAAEWGSKPFTVTCESEADDDAR
jgi:hypothetical protein